MTFPPPARGRHSGRGARNLSPSAAGASVSVWVIEPPCLSHARGGAPPSNYFGARERPERDACLQHNTPHARVFPSKATNQRALVGLRLDPLGWPTDGAR